MQRIDRRPLYLQVHDILIDRIARGHWRLGAPLPAEGALAEELDVSVGTLRKALELLESGHIITRQQGRGTFVADYASSGMSMRFNPLRAADASVLLGPTELLEVSCGAATPDEALRLNLAAGGPVVRCRTLRRREDVPYMLEHASIPPARFGNFAGGLPENCEILALAQCHGIVIGRVTERVRAVSTPHEVAHVLDATPGAPILELDRTTHDVNGDVIEWRLAWCNLGDGWYAQES